MKATSEPQTPSKVEEGQTEDSLADTGDTRENSALNVPIDPESDEDVPVEAEELQEALSRAPPVNSSYLPLPWKGRLGYVSISRPQPVSTVVV
jgi:UV DNA damage endonuclease